jgi:hypothetical protein
MTLHCLKTGRWWRVQSEGWAHIIARQMGLKDYVVCPDDAVPQTIKDRAAR